MIGIPEVELDPQREVHSFPKLRTILHSIENLKYIKRKKNGPKTLSGILELRTSSENINEIRLFN